MNIKKLKNNGGFTLVEIIVSLAIIGILAVAFFSMFGFGMKTIIISGHNSISNFNTQSILENRISGDLDSPEQLTEISADIKLYQGGTLKATIPGKTIQVSYPYNNNTTKTAVTFIPN